MRGAGAVALRENAAGGEDLDDVHAVLDLRADGLAHLVDAIGDLVAAMFGEQSDVGLRGETVDIAMPAGDGDPGPAGDDARSGDRTFIDGVAQIDGRKRRRADIADGGEAGEQGGVRVANRGEALREGRVFEVVDGIVAVGAGGEMSVAVNQARQHGGMREIDDRRSGGNRDTRRIRPT